MGARTDAGASPAPTALCHGRSSVLGGLLGKARRFTVEQERARDPLVSRGKARRVLATLGRAGGQLVWRRRVSPVYVQYTVLGNCG